MDPELQKKLDEMDQKIAAIYSSVEKTRKYFLGTLVVMAVAFVLPLIGLLFAIPTLLSTYRMMGDLSL